MNTFVWSREKLNVSPSWAQMYFESILEQMHTLMYIIAVITSSKEIMVFNRLFVCSLVSTIMQKKNCRHDGWGIWPEEEAVTFRSGSG